MSETGAGGGPASGHRFHPTVLREYDIRGTVGETLFAADARALGQAYATMLGPRAASESASASTGGLARRSWPRRSGTACARAG